MPESKTIEIDEVITADRSAGDDASPRSASKGSTSKGSGAATGSATSATGSATSPPPSDNPFADFQKSLGWKTRATLWLTQKFLYLRSKSWGKWVIVPAALLAIMLAIPLGLIFSAVITARSFFISRRSNSGV